MTGRGGRRVGRLLIALAIAADVVVAFLLLAPPRSMGLTGSAPSGPSVGPILAIGVIANLVGLAWLVRIHLQVVARRR